MSGKKKTKTVTTPTNPDWVTNAIQQSTQRASKLADMDPYQFVTEANPLQAQAGQGAASLGTDRGWLDSLMGSSAPQVQAQSLLTGLSDYQSPYTRDVVNTALADFDQGAGKTRAQQELDLANSGAFGGSGAAITRSMTEDALNRGRASTSANLYDQAFTRAAGLSADDANRRQAAGTTNAGNELSHQQLLAQLGLGKEASDRANVATQMDAGGVLRQIAQDEVRAPLDLEEWLARINAQSPYNLFNGQNSNSVTKSSNPLGAIGSLAMGLGGLIAMPATGGASGAALFSDQRLKRDIQRLGERSDGLSVYLYRYLWSPLWFIGAMAQEALRIKPEAVSTHQSGFLMLDYGKL